MSEKEMAIIQALWDEYCGFIQELDDRISDCKEYSDLGDLTSDTESMKILRKYLRNIGIKIVGKN